MNLTALLLVTLIGGCFSKPTPPSAAMRPADLSPAVSSLVPIPIANLKASVCVFGCSGPQPVDADGNVYSATYLDLEATTAITEVTLRQFELFDAAGVVVAHGTAAAPLTVGNGQRPFAGRVAVGEHVRLWVSVRLDARAAVLQLRPPVRFRLALAVQDGALLSAQGEVSAAGVTG